MVIIELQTRCQAIVNLETFCYLQVPRVSPLRLITFSVRNNIAYNVSYGFLPLLDERNYTH